jgi:hypothetical protein
MPPPAPESPPPRNGEKELTPAATIWAALANPVVLIAVMLILSVFFLIGMAIFGFDRILSSMSRVDFARGLITYLFAIVTIGTAVLLVVSGLTAPGDQHADRRFERGKEILSLLLGVFGTIIGFYFGSEVNKPPEGGLQLAPLRLSVAQAKVTVTTFAGGGKGPYEYAVTIGDAVPKVFEPVPENGWIVKDLDSGGIPKQASVPVVATVRDADGHSVRQSATMMAPQ